jgi:hypothetical protein
MKKYFLSVVIVLLFFRCTKSSFNDLSGSQTLKGLVVLYDTLQGVQSIVPAKNFKIYIKYSGSSNGFLYSSNANGQAQFSFQGIDTARSYTIYAVSDTGVIKYYGEKIYPANSYSVIRPDTLKLYPSQQNQNGIHLIVTDELLRPVPNVTAWVFNNATLFASDTSAGRIFDMTVNNYGVNNRLNIAPGTYYLRVKTRIGGLDLAGEDTVVVPAAGIRDANLVLRNIPLARNGIEATITDMYSTPVAGANVYCYRSQYVFENDTIQFNNSLFTMNSNASGLASAYIITPGTYYLRAVKIINSDTLKKTATVSVSANGISPVPMMLQ